MKLRLASYNLHKCVGTDGRRDPARVIEVMNDIGADVLALQEADLRMGARPTALPERMIETETDFDLVRLAESPVSLGWHGQALLARRGLRLADSRRVPLPGLEPRGAVMAELERPDGTAIRVVGVHLGLLRLWRQKQLHAIRRLLDELPAMPTAILGDFNEWSPTRGMEPLGAAFAVHAPGRSFHARRPLAALDRVALDGALRLDDAGVVDTGLSRRASDHLPIWADVSLPAPNDVAPLRNGIAAVPATR